MQERKSDNKAAALERAAPVNSAVNIEYQQDDTIEPADNDDENIEPEPLDMEQEADDE